jgi:hypothetical protein
MKIRIKKPAAAPAPAPPRGIKHLPARTDAEGLKNYHRKPPVDKRILLPSAGEVHDMSAEHLLLWSTLTSEFNRALRLERARQQAIKEEKHALAKVEADTRDSALVYCYDKYSDYIPF